MATSSSANDDDSDYVEFHKNLPASSENSPELTTIIEEIVQMHDDINTVLEEFSTNREIFTQTHKLNSMYISSAETTTTETPQDNGITSPLLTQPSLPNSHPLDAPTSLPSHTRVDASAAVCLASESNLPGVLLKETEYALFGQYQYWVHQNTGTNLDVRIDEDGHWKVI